MFETTKDIYWLILGIGVGVVALMLAYLLFKIAKLVEEAQHTVKDINSKLKQTDKLLEEGVPALTSMIQTVQILNQQILRPLVSVGAAFKAFNIFRRKKSDHND